MSPAYMFPAHYFHPLIIHFPIVLPFVLLALVVCVKEKGDEFLRIIVALSIIQFLFSIAAFYSGQWVAETVGPQISGVELDMFDWHTISGRVHLWASGLVAIAAVIQKIATKNQKLFSFLFILFLVAQIAASAFSGYTGGKMVHEFGVNRIIVTQ